MCALASRAASSVARLSREGLVGEVDKEGDGGVGAEKGWVVEREGRGWRLGCCGAKSVMEEELVGGEVRVG